MRALPRSAVRNPAWDICRQWHRSTLWLLLLWGVLPPPAGAECLTGEAFASPIFGAAANAFAGTAADLNGDGLDDVVTLYNWGVLTVGLGSPPSQPGVFGGVSNLSFTVPGWYHFGVAAGDVDRDGLTDLVFTSNEGLCLLLAGGVDGQWDQTFQPPLAIGTVGDPRRVELADIDGDGRLDAVVGSYGNAFAIHLGLETGGLGPPTSFPSPGRAFSVATRDIDGDGDRDVAVAALNGRVFVYRSTSHPGVLALDTPDAYVTSGQPLDIVFGDFNADSVADIAVTDHPQKVAILLGRALNGLADGTFEAPVFYPCTWAYSLDAGDCDGDGLVDLVIGSDEFKEFELFRGVGDGTFSSAEPYFGGYGATDVHLADVDGDGARDVAYAATWFSGVMPGRCRSVAGHEVGVTIEGRGRVSRSSLRRFFPVGSVLTLRATPSPGARFVGWTGDTVALGEVLAVSIHGDIQLTARFERDPSASPHLLSVSDVSPDQGGFVRLRWTGCAVDNPASASQFCCYRVERYEGEGSEIGWVSLAQLSPTNAEVYEAVVATPSDSTSAGTHSQLYRVVAVAASDTASWLSNEVTGYSVDNIAPPAPAQVSGVFASGIATLFWPAVTVADLSHYAIYRATGGYPSIDDGHRVAVTNSTSIIDTPGFYSLYVVTAVDVHGGESQGTPFVPLNPSATDDTAQPISFTVGLPGPTPMMAGTTFRVGSPVQTTIHARIVDTMGREVVSLLDGPVQAGWIQLRWDAQGRDGAPVAAGVYFLQVRSPLGQASRRVVVFR